MFGTHALRHELCIFGAASTPISEGCARQTVTRLINRHRKALIALALAMVFVAVAIPTCRMIGCSMGGAASWGNNAVGLGFYGDCGGTWVTSATPVAAVLPSAYGAIVALLGLAVVAVAITRRPVLVEVISEHASDPPPPPEDPRGERLRI